MDNLLLHPATERALHNLLQSPSQAVLLSGLPGAGKGTVAARLAARYLGKTQSVQLANEPAIHMLGNDVGTIGIDAIRGLQKFMTLKTTGSRAIRRVAIIEHAETMTTEAQNALLKILEEPPADSAIIMTCDNPRSLLPTVNSRLQHIKLLSPDKQATVAYFMQQNHKTVDIEKAYHLSGGAVGLVTALLDPMHTHPLGAHIVTAKQLYGQATFERLTAVDSLAKQKTDLPGLLGALKRIAVTAMEQAVIKDQLATAQKWHVRLTAIHQAEVALGRNANAKLLLTDLFLKLA